MLTSSKKILTPFLLLTLALTPLSSCGKAKNPTLQLDVSPIDSHTQSQNVSVVIEHPTEGGNDMMPIVVKVGNLAIGAPDTVLDLPTDPRGELVRLYIDGNPDFLVGTSQGELNAADQDTDQNFESTILFQNKEGYSTPHLLRAFAVTAFGESYKNKGSFAIRAFGGVQSDTKSPFLTYNEPSNQIAHKAGHPILLDFQLSNVTLAQNGHHVILEIEDSNGAIYKNTLTQWRPYLINGLQAGNYRVTLRLFDGTNKEILPLFNGENTRQITVK